jgi:hypothetical protein
LRTLDLSVNGLGNEAAEAVAGSPRLPDLAVLRMGYNRIGDEGGQVLAASPHLANLRRLDLTGNNLSKAVRAALREWFRRRVAL